MRILGVLLSFLLIISGYARELDVKTNVQMYGIPKTLSFDKLPKDIQKKAIEICKKEKCEPKKMTFYKFSESFGAELQKKQSSWECWKCCRIFCCGCRKVGR